MVLRMKTEIIINRRENLCFIATDICGPRTFESFDLLPISKTLEESALKVVERCLFFLPLEFHPEQLWIDLEYSGKIIFQGSERFELIPISLVMSQQQPASSRIRMGMHEIGNDIKAFESILAHEMGHMLPEWALRKSNLVSEQDSVIPFWSKPIYEGIADWLAAVITEQTVIGSDKIWFSRNINEFKSISEARDTIGGMSKILEEGFKSEQLAPKFIAYQEWLNLVFHYFGDKVNPYAEGQWIASQLWEISNEIQGAKKLFKKILEIGLTGKELQDSESFVALLRSSPQINNEI